MPYSPGCAKIGAGDKYSKVVDLPKLVDSLKLQIYIVGRFLDFADLVDLVVFVVFADFPVLWIFSSDSRLAWEIPARGEEGWETS